MVEIIAQISVRQGHKLEDDRISYWSRLVDFEEEFCYITHPQEFQKDKFENWFYAGWIVKGERNNKLLVLSRKGYSIFELDCPSPKIISNSRKNVKLDSLLVSTLYSAYSQGAIGIEFADDELGLVKDLF